MLAAASANTYKQGRDSPPMDCLWKSIEIFSKQEHLKIGLSEIYDSNQDDLSDNNAIHFLACWERRRTNFPRGWWDKAKQLAESIAERTHNNKQLKAGSSEETIGGGRKGRQKKQNLINKRKKEKFKNFVPRKETIWKSTKEFSAYAHN